MSARLARVIEWDCISNKAKCDRVGDREVGKSVSFTTYDNSSNIINGLKKSRHSQVFPLPSILSTVGCFLLLSILVHCACTHHIRCRSPEVWGGWAPCQCCPHRGSPEQCPHLPQRSCAEGDKVKSGKYQEPDSQVFPFHATPNTVCLITVIPDLLRIPLIHPLRDEQISSEIFVESI